MAAVALVTADTTNAAATNTKADLEAGSHTVTLVADSAIGSTDFSSYDAIVAMRLSGTSTAVSPTVTTALESVWDGGKPMIIGMVGAGMTAGTARKTATDNMGVTGGDGNGSWTIVANSAGHTEVDVVNTAHAIMAGQSLGALAIYSTANIRASLGSGRSSTGTELLEEDPNAGDLSAWFAVESGTTLLDTTSSPARLVYGDIPYGGQGSLNAAGEGLLSAAVNWVAGITAGVTVAVPAANTITVQAGTPSVTAAASATVIAPVATVSFGAQTPQAKGGASVKPAAASVVLSNGVPTISAVSTFTAHGVEFDATAYLTRGAGLTGAADGKLLTLSFWINTTDANATNAILYGQSGGVGGITVNLLANGRIRVNGSNSTPTTILSIESSSGYNDGNWHHILVSVDMANASNRHLYVDDVSDLATVTTYTDDTLDLTVTEWSVAASNAGAAKLTACLGEMWFAGAYVDFSVEANRRKFISASGFPVSLGSDGSAPTGSAPLIYLGGNGQEAAGWETNKGGGGGFTENGTLADCATDPTISSAVLPGVSSIALSPAVPTIIAGIAATVNAIASTITIAVETPDIAAVLSGQRISGVSINEGVSFPEGVTDIRMTVGQAGVNDEAEEQS